MFVQNTIEVRTFFIDVRTKMKSGQLLQPLEALVADIIERHPEYDDVLADPDKALSDDFLTRHFEINPFLHMGLHVALKEQIEADRPRGVARLFQTQTALGGHDPHTVEHRMMACLSQALSDAQQLGALPDERAYLDCLSRIG